MCMSNNKEDYEIEKEETEQKKSSCIDGDCMRAVISFYTEELKKNLRIALKPFISNLNEVIEINIKLGDLS